MNKFILALIVLALCALSQGETPRSASEKADLEALAKLTKQTAIEAVTHSPQSNTACAFTFQTGADLASLKYCVTNNGNIVQFEVPRGVPMISQVSLAEGYGVCDLTSNVSYADWGGEGDTGNWGQANVVSHSANQVKIARTTSDGIWTLTQTISQVGGGAPNAKISMALHNNTTVKREVFLVRYADVSAGGFEFNDFDSTVNSALGWNSASPQGESMFRYGIALENLGTVNFGYDALVQNTPSAPDACNPFANAASGLINMDGSVVMFYDMRVAKSKTMTVNMAYKGW